MTTKETALANLTEFVTEQEKRSQGFHEEIATWTDEAIHYGATAREIADAFIAGIPAHNPESGTDPEPIREMVRKLDERPKGNTGYVTQTPEIIRIMSNLSPLVSWNVFDRFDTTGMVSVELKTVFHLDREAL